MNIAKINIHKQFLRVTKNKKIKPEGLNDFALHLKL